MSWLAFWRRSRRAKEQPRQKAALGGLRMLGGRRYTRGVPYILPSDGEELNRLDFQHYMLRYALKGNFATPLRQPREILDVACGTGRWATEVAMLFPQANVIGFDVTPLSTDSSSTGARPDNFAFIQGNMLEGLPFPDNTFDFTHQRLVIAALPANQWQRQTRELLRVTRLGGWVELVEGGAVHGAPGVDTLNAVGNRMTEKRGISLDSVTKLDEYLRQAGAQRVESRIIQLPVGQKAGRLGALAEADYLAIVTSMRGYLINMGLITEEEHNRAFAQAKEELASGSLTWSFYIAYGQK